MDCAAGAQYLPLTSALSTAPSDVPVYEFSCETCGAFEALRTIEEASEPMLCPTCGSSARRLYSAPGVTRTSATVAQAHARNERSAHEPEVVQRPPPEAPAPAPSPRRGHGRPWQLGH